MSYNNLEKSSQKYIDDNVLIFSNLFGVLKASDVIPDYKLKQGESFYDLELRDGEFSPRAQSRVIFGKETGCLPKLEFGKEGLKFLPQRLQRRQKENII